MYTLKIPDILLLNKGNIGLENTEGKVNRVNFLVSVILRHIDIEVFIYVNPISRSYINSTCSKISKELIRSTNASYNNC